MMGKLSTNNATVPELLEIFVNLLHTSKMNSVGSEDVMAVMNHLDLLARNVLNRGLRGLPECACARQGGSELSPSVLA